MKECGATGAEPRVKLGRMVISCRHPHSSPGEKDRVVGSQLLPNSHLDFQVNWEEYTQRESGEKQFFFFFFFFAFFFFFFFLELHYIITLMKEEMYVIHDLDQKNVEPKKKKKKKKGKLEVDSLGRVSSPLSQLFWALCYLKEQSYDPCLDHLVSYKGNHL
uniref:Uncharacterized protein n=1 Tax=Sus scrofa TaxID=9823 RepID=A0A4X1SGF5_PIG